MVFSELVKKTSTSVVTKIKFVKIRPQANIVDIVYAASTYISKLSASQTTQAMVVISPTIMADKIVTWT